MSPLLLLSFTLSPLLDVPFLTSCFSPSFFSFFHSVLAFYSLLSYFISSFLLFLPSSFLCFIFSIYLSFLIPYLFSLHLYFFRSPSPPSTVLLLYLTSFLLPSSFLLPPHLSPLHLSFPTFSPSVPYTSLFHTLSSVFSFSFLFPLFLLTSHFLFHLIFLLHLLFPSFSSSFPSTSIFHTSSSASASSLLPPSSLLLHITFLPST